MTSVPTRLSGLVIMQAATTGAGIRPGIMDALVGTILCITAPGMVAGMIPGTTAIMAGAIHIILAGDISAGIILIIMLADGAIIVGIPEPCMPAT